MYLRFRDRAAEVGVDLDIVPGILPVTNYQTQCLCQFTSRWPKNMDGLDADDQATQLIGANIMDQVKVLAKEGVKHFHFYTLNRRIYAIYKMLCVLRRLIITTRPCLRC